MGDSIQKAKIKLLQIKRHIQLDACSETAL